MPSKWNGIKICCWWQFVKTIYFLSFLIIYTLNDSSIPLPFPSWITIFSFGLIKCLYEWYIIYSMWCFTYCFFCHTHTNKMNISQFIDKRNGLPCDFSFSKYTMCFVHNACYMQCSTAEMVNGKQKIYSFRCKTTVFHYTNSLYLYYEFDFYARRIDFYYFKSQT